MRRQINQYYACNDAGYVKYQNVKMNHLPVIKEIPVTSRCNQILPYKVHKVQVLHPNITVAQSQPPKQAYNEHQMKQNKFNTFHSESLMKSPASMLEKDQVHSVHMEGKISSRTITQQKCLDLTKSSYTNLQRSKADMKRSIFQTNMSNYTADTNYKQKQKIDMIISELLKQKEKRKTFQEKYQTLFNMITTTTNQKVKTSASDIDQDKLSQKPQKSHYSPAKNKSYKKRYQLKSNTSNSSESEQQQPIIINYRKSHRNRTVQPIILNIDPAKVQQQISFSTPRLNTLDKKQQFLQIRQNINQLAQQITTLNQNVQFLQKRLDQHQKRHQKEELKNQLKEKQMRIQQVLRQNQKIRETNQLLISDKLCKEANSNSVSDNTKATIIGFFMSFLVVLLVLNLKSSLC